MRSLPIYKLCFSEYLNRQDRGGCTSTHPVAYVVRRADIDQGADPALEERGYVVLRRETPVVEVLAEG